MMQDVILRDAHHHLMELHNNKRIEEIAGEVLCKMRYISGEPTGYVYGEVIYVNGYKITDSGYALLRERGYLTDNKV